MRPGGWYCPSLPVCVYLLVKCREWPRCSFLRSLWLSNNVKIICTKPQNSTPACLCFRSFLCKSTLWGVMVEKSPSRQCGHPQELLLSLGGIKTGELGNSRFLLQVKLPMFVSCWCWNTFPQMSWLQIIQVYYLTFLEVESPKLAWQGWSEGGCRITFLLEVLGENPSLCLLQISELNCIPCLAEAQ